MRGLYRPLDRSLDLYLTFEVAARGEPDLPRPAWWVIRCLDRKTKNSDATDRAAGASGLSRGVRGVTQTKPGRKILKTEAARAR